MANRPTAAEFWAQLQSRPEVQAANARRDAEARKIVLAERVDQGPILKQLSRINCHIGDLRVIGFLKLSLDQQKNIASVLLENIDKPYISSTRGFLSLALRMPGASYLLKEIIEIYRRENDERVKDDLANCIIWHAERDMNADMMKSLISLILDRNNGPSRAILLISVEKILDPSVDQMLQILGSEPIMEKMVLQIQKKRESRRSKKRL